MSYAYYEIVPTTRTTEPISNYHAASDLAQKISLDFIMAHDLHYTQVFSVYRISMIEEDVTALTLMLPDTLILRKCKL